MNWLNLFPHAINPLECLTGHGADSMFWPWHLFWTATINGLLYCGILWRWYVSVPRSRIQKALMLIFLFCAISGYWTFSLSFYFPGPAYTLKLYTQYILIFLDLVFLWDTRRLKFQLTVEHQEHQNAVQKVQQIAIGDLEKKINLRDTLIRQRRELEDLIT